jgi:hypothetical protein
MQIYFERKKKILFVWFWTGGVRKKILIVRKAFFYSRRMPGGDGQYD